MTPSPQLAVDARAGGTRKRRGFSPLVGVLVLGGVFSGVACGAADSVSDATYKCEPKLCLAPDEPEGPPDGPSLCPPGVCNYQTQEGCPDTQTCAVHIDTMTGEVSPLCVAVGNRKAGETCDTRNTGMTPPTPDKLCGRGLICVGEQGKPQTCRKLCCAEQGASYGDWRACDAGESCIRQLQARVEIPAGSKTFITVDAGVSFCVPVNNCDVLDKESCKDPDAPDGGEGVRPVCRIVDPLGNVACQPKGNATLGEKCQRLDQCGAVQKCAQRTGMDGIPLTELTCRRLCRMAPCGDEGCPTAEGVCVHFKRDPEGVGECTPNFDQKAYCLPPDGGLPSDFDGG